MPKRTIEYREIGEGELVCEFEDPFEREEIESFVFDLLKTLPTKHREIVCYRFGIFDGRFRTFREMAKHFNLSAQRIQEIVSKSIRKMKCCKQEDVYKQICDFIGVKPIINKPQIQLKIFPRTENYRTVKCKKHSCRSIQEQDLRKSIDEVSRLFGKIKQRIDRLIAMRRLGYVSSSFLN